MKRWIALAALFALLLTGCSSAEAAQTEAPKEDKLVLASYKPSGGSEEKYFYNEAGQRTRREILNSGWQNLYEYYPDGVLKEERTVYPESYTNVIEYDTKGNRVRVYNLEENKQTPIGTYVNSYDDQGRLLEVRYEGADDGYGRTLEVYTYAQDGSYTVEFTEEYNSNGQFHTHTHQVSSFTAEGTLIGLTADVEWGETVDRQNTCYLDGKGNPQSWQRSYYVENSVFTRSTEFFENSYDDQGRLMKVQMYLTVNNQFADRAGEYKNNELQTVTEYTYDDAGRKVGEHIERVNEGMTWDNVWEYDDQGNLLHFTSICQDGSNSTMMQEEVYTYLPLSQVLDK